MTQPASVGQYLSREEIATCLERSDLRAAAVLGANYLIIVLAFALAIVWPNPVTIVLGVLLLGARQLGLAVLLHECAHSTFFRARRSNERIGHWLCGGPTNTSLFAYRDYHLNHHRFAGTEQDPDLAMALAYPTSKAGMRRKFTRDLSGRTGARDSWRELQRLRWPRNAPFLVFHAALLVALTAVGAPWAYLMWWAARLLVYPAVTRLRFMAEHGVAGDRLAADVRDNTCTTLARWWERLLVAPNRVNFHVEHHLLAGVPSYRLPAFHRLLASRGFFADGACLSHGYAHVIRRAIRSESAAEPA